MESALSSLVAPQVVITTSDATRGWQSGLYGSSRLFNVQCIHKNKDKDKR